jgi:hypothetical protein
MGVTRAPLPRGAWEALFPRALALIDDFKERGGITDPFWTFGGGTVLMFRYGHRLSKDIDVFVPDPQYLGYVTPRLSDRAADLTQEYTEAGTFVKLQFEEGEVDFVAAPNLLSGDDAWENWEIMGRTVKVETAAEIIAKKMYHRGDRVTARDLFDLALVIEREPEALRVAAPFLTRHRAVLLDQIAKPGRGLLASFEAIQILNYKPTYTHCVEVASAFLRAMPAPDGA